MSEPRQYTTDEIRQQFIEHVRFLINESSRDLTRTCEDRIALFAFSLLCVFDGVTDGMPAFNLVPATHPTDMEFRRSHGENWWPPEGDGQNIANGALHEMLYAGGKWSPVRR